ncbi:MAG: ImmA/IrrE family metallo-endopeptidase [Allosphingosinicella sp.]
MTDFAHSNRIDGNELNLLREYTADVPVRVGSLAKALGIDVVLATLPMNISGMIHPRGDGFIIKVNRFEPKERQRFTIAHEIAHFLLHKDRILQGVTDSVLYRSRLSSALEAEANRLAADIIMPREAINRALVQYDRIDDEIIAELAEKFRVSGAAMQIRVS